MRTRVVPALAVSWLWLAGSAAAQPPPPSTAEPAADVADLIEGAVVDGASRWTADGRSIVTESVVADADGAELTVRQLGGTVDGVTMRVIPSPPTLRPGDRVTLRVQPTHLSRVVTLREVLALHRPLERAVRTTNRTGAPLYWRSGCVFVSYDAEGTGHLPGEQELEIADAVFARWRADTRACSYLRFELEGKTDGPAEVGFDGVNLLKFRNDRWCRPAADDDEVEDCYDPSAAGITTITFIEDEGSDRNGEILDADIEINAVHFSVSAGGASLGTPPCMSDLANTLTHEVGHLMGLDHTCWTGGGERPVDIDGNAVPECFSPSLPPEVTEATMYAFQECGETKKADLEPGDIAGICATYPLADDPQSCKRARLRARAGCCAIASSRGGPGGGAPPSWPAALALGLLALATLTAARRRPAPRAARGSEPRAARLP